MELDTTERCRFNMIVDAEGHYTQNPRSEDDECKEMLCHLRLFPDSTVQYQPMFPLVRLLPDLLSRPRV